MRAAAAVCVAAGLAYWMLADTFRRYSPAAEDHPLRVSFWGPYEEFEMWKEMLANFRAGHPDVPVKMEYFPSRYDQKIQQLFVANDAPDVILWQDEPFPILIETDPNTGAEPKFLDLTRFAESRGESLDLEAFWKTAVDYFGQYRGNGPHRRWHQYGMPIWGGCNLIYYNRDCFRRAGVTVASLPGDKGLLPAEGGKGWLLDDEKWTVDDFVDLCRILTVDRDGDGRIDQFGFNIPYVVYWLPMLYAYGADILTEDRTRTVFYGPAVEETLALWQDLIYKYHVSPRPAELGQMGEAVGFFTGRVAMFCTGPWGMPFLNVSGVDYDVLHVPRGRQGRQGQRGTRITWDAVTIFANSKKKDDAWLLVKHLTSLQSMKVVSKVQRSIPARKAAAEYFIQVNPKVSVRKFVDAAGSYARMQPITRHWSIMARAWSDAMSELHRDNPARRLTPAEAIGRFYSDYGLAKVLPPADANAADQYRQLYRRRLGEASAPQEGGR